MKALAWRLPLLPRSSKGRSANFYRNCLHELPCPFLFRANRVKCHWEIFKDLELLTNELTFYLFHILGYMYLDNE